MLNFTCPITALIHGQSALLMPTLQDNDYLTPFPIFNLSNSELIALKYKLPELNKMELQLVVIAALQKFQFFSIPTTFGEALPKTFWIKEGTPYAFLRDFANSVLEALEAYRNLPKSKQELIPLIQNLPSSFPSWKLLIERAQELLDSISFAARLKRKVEVAGTAEALMSNAASVYYKELPSEEKAVTLEDLLTDNHLPSSVSSAISEFKDGKEEVTKEELAAFNLAVLQVAEVVNQTSIEEVSVIYYFKELLEAKSNVTLTRATIGNFKVWTGAISLTSTKVEKKTLTLAERIAMTRGSLTLKPTQVSQVVDTLDLSDL